METNLTSNHVWEPKKYIIKLKYDSLNVRRKKQIYRNKINPVVIFQECVPENSTIAKCGLQITSEHPSGHSKEGNKIS